MQLVLYAEKKFKMTFKSIFERESERRFEAVWSKNKK